MKHLLDNIFWHALSGPQAHFAAGNDAARRYAPGFSSIVAFADRLRPNFSALAAVCEPGEHFYTEGWTGAAPAGWQIKVESTMLKMIWDADLPPADEAPDAVPLNAKHALQALELAELTHPGPFGLRTIELGEYFGVFGGERLIAMAGERSHAGVMREISGVCTHPDFQGRGLAKRLMRKLIRREMLRNETPFLHVMHDNTSARQLYERMGFRNYKETVVRVISRH